MKKDRPPARPAAASTGSAPGSGTEIDAYIAGFPERTRRLLEELRRTIRTAAPEATERISYRMPTFHQDGNLIHFAAYEHHIGLYPTPSGIEAFEKDLSRYKRGKGSVQFPLDEPLPLELVERIVAYRLAEGLARKRMPKRAPAREKRRQGMEGRKPLARREYRDGVELSIIGFGGIVVCGHEQAEADRIVAEAIDRGVNYFDVAPSYFEGEAELKLGNALRGRREGVFLACKTERRDAAGARAELERSLVRAHTDRFELYQFHAVTTLAEVEAILGPGGAGETFRKARDEGKVRWLGASCHSVEAALALIEAFPLDSILFPINYVCWANGNFGPQVLEAARKRGIARLALKSLAHTPWAEGEERSYPNCWYRPVDAREAARASLYFTLSQALTAAIPPGDVRLFRMALDLACEFEPLDAAAQRAILDSAMGLEPIFRCEGAAAGPDTSTGHGLAKPQIPWG